LVQLGVTKTYTPNDKWAQKAKASSFRARSVYKLKELDAKFHLIKPGLDILDVGAAPGSWLQYVSTKIGSKGHVLGVDLQEIAPIAANVTTVVADINSWQPDRQFDLILSDIAPSTTGIPLVDQRRSLQLSKAVFALAKPFLKPGGTLVMKVFDSQEFHAFTKELRAHFSKVTVVKVQASRGSSREVYVVCS
jgi:23S rRNA (uridine2552-2'-O)-methyltransferase